MHQKLLVVEVSPSDVCGRPLFANLVTYIACDSAVRSNAYVCQSVAATCIRGCGC